MSLSTPVIIRLPGILASMNDDEREVQVRGESVAEALDDLVRRRPVLKRHLFDDAGSLRRHLRCVCNDQVASARDGLSQAVQAGDRITILNSVSGG